jgi:copper chaperone CopZ
MNAVSILLIGLLAAVVLLAAAAAVRRMKKGSACCGPKGETVKRTGVSDRNKQHYPYLAEAVITQMTCDNCAARVENALNREEGIWAKVRIDTHKALIRGKQPVDREKVRRAVVREGYGMSAFKELPR